MRKIGFVLAVALVAIALPLAAQADPATNQSVDVTGWNKPRPESDGRRPRHGVAHSTGRRHLDVVPHKRTSG